MLAVFMGICRKISRGPHQHFAYPFQVADDAVHMDINKRLYSFHMTMPQR